MKIKFTTALLALLLSTSVSHAEVYAVVNGDKLTDKDLKPMIGMFHDAKSVADLNENEKKMIIDQGIEKKLILQKATEEKVSDDPAFKEIVADFTGRLKVEFWMRREMDKIQVSENQIREYFERNSDKYGKDTKLESVKGEISEAVKMEQFQIAVDKKLSDMKKEAEIAYK